jgi:hypothetical protein
MANTWWEWTVQEEVSLFRNIWAWLEYRKLIFLAAIHAIPVQ